MTSPFLNLAPNNSRCCIIGYRGFILYLLTRNTFILNVVRYIAAANNPSNTIKPIFIQKNKEYKNYRAFDRHAKQYK